MSYVDELRHAMSLLASHGAIFLGQGVGCSGTTMSQTLEHIDPRQRLEMPVAEELQTGMATGMSLTGILPVCIFPRWNFVLRAADQIINHLDRFSLFSKYRPKVIIRTAVPSTDPFDPGPQHSDDFTEAFRLMLKTVQIAVLNHEDMILPEYRKALWYPDSTILVEFTDAYRNERAKAAA